MSTPLARPTRVNTAAKYHEFLSQMYESFKHDDGRDVEQWDEVEIPAAFSFIRFRTEEELTLLDPSEPEFWNSKFHNNCRQMRRDPGRTARLPSDPLSDEAFERIQRRVCNKPSHFSLLEQSIRRCEVPDEELEKDAEDISKNEDFEDLEKEIEGLFRAFESHLEGNLDASDVCDDDDEDEAEHVRKSTQNILEELSESEAIDETVVETTECTHEVSESNATPKEQYPPLHLLTALQRRLVKLDLY